MHDKPGVNLVPLPNEPNACEILLTEIRTDGKKIDGFLNISGVNYAVIESGY